MTAKKYVAESLKTILDCEMVQCILNRSCGLADAIDEALSWWDFDLQARRPSPAYDEYGIFKGTDLDLACFMYALAGRGTIISIPYYKAHTQAKVREDQVLKSKANRNGELLDVLANKAFFKFSIRIMDQNVIGEDKVGDFRTFSLTDHEGNWSDGWHSIQFEPTLKENRFITENKLWSGHRIVFKNFIHPNRWTSFFGRHYVISKMLIERLEEEAKYLNSEVKRLQEAGIKFPETGDVPQTHDYEYGDTQSVKFPAFEAKIYIPETQITGEYPKFPETQEGLLQAYRLRKEYNRVIGKLRFMTRASEYAHHKNPDRFPAWMKNVSWEHGFREPRKRTDWDRLKLFQPAVGQQSISILKRLFEKTARIAA